MDREVLEVTQLVPRYGMHSPVWSVQWREVASGLIYRTIIKAEDELAAFNLVMSNSHAGLTSLDGEETVDADMC